MPLEAEGAVAPEGTGTPASTDAKPEESTPTHTQHELEAFKRRDAALKRAQEAEAAKSTLTSELDELRQWREQKELEEMQSKAKSEEEVKKLLEDREKLWANRLEEANNKASEIENRFREQRKKESIAAQLKDAGFRNEYMEFVGTGPLSLELAIENPDGSLDLRACLPEWRQTFGDAFLASPNAPMQTPKKAASLPDKNLSATAWMQKYMDSHDVDGQAAADAYFKMTQTS